MNLVTQSSPRFVLTSGDRQKVILDPITLPSGRTLADFATFELTFRADPDWPRTTQELKEAAKSADPVGDGWAVVGSVVSGTVVSSTLEFIVPSSQGLSAGEDRYAADVRGIGGTAGPAHILQSTWVTVRASVGS